MSDQDKRIHQRIICNSDKATIRYVGPLRHEVEGALKSKINEVWFGIEWDNPGRGKHTGTVNGYEYFKCEKEGAWGSLVLQKKAEQGYQILEAIIRKYFKDAEAMEILQHKENLIEILDAKNKDFKNKKIEDIKTEFDEDGFIYTFQERTKRIEFLGFDKHWKRVNELDTLKEFGLNDKKVLNFGPIGTLKQLIPNMVNLSLENNLFYDWQQIIHLGSE